jgi:uncharacterized membrane protein YoaK (UPF0700 family)
MHRAADHASLRKDLISAIASDVVGVLASSLWSTRSTAMRAVVLLVLTLVSLAFSHLAQAETEPGRIVLAQRILSCGEQANTLYVQYTALKCNTRSPSQPDRCKPLMDNICAIASKCERAKVFCVK